MTLIIFVVKDLREHKVCMVEIGHHELPSHVVLVNLVFVYVELREEVVNPDEHENLK